MIVVRVTDETVPDAGKKRYALSLSIHGIERAGVEGGTRAMEDLGHRRARPGDARAAAGRAQGGRPGGADVRRGAEEHDHLLHLSRTRTAGSAARCRAAASFFQRYNGNGVDLNRDWPDIGFSFRPYSGLSEPESRALAGFFDDVKVERRQLRRGRRPARAAVRRRAVVHAAPPRPPRRSTRTSASARRRRRSTATRSRRSPGRRSSSRTTRRRAAARRARPDVLRHGLREDLRPDLGLGLRHDQLHDDGRAGRLLRLVGGARARTASTTRCRSRTSTRTSPSTRTPSSCTWTATRR